MHSIAPRQSIFEKLTPPVLRHSSAVEARRARLLGIVLAVCPILGFVMCALVALIDRVTGHLVWPIVIAVTLLWMLFPVYWLRGNYQATVHMTLLLFNGLILYFAFIWSVSAPTTVWALASASLSTYLLKTHQAATHIAVLLLGFALLVTAELHGVVTPVTLDPSTQAAMSLASLIVAAMFTMLITEEIRFLYERTEQILEDEARTDVLTGLPNRRQFFDIAQREEAAAKRGGWGMAVLLIDMDRFKNINDTWGHATGDKALKAVADILGRMVPKFIGTPARIAGDEFAALISRSDLSECTQLANRLREAVESARVYSSGGQLIQVSVSIGVAEFLPVQDENIDDGLARADKLLYKAKDTGRNTVVEDERLRLVGAA